MSKLRTNQIETLDGLNTKNVATLVDDINNAEVTTSGGTQMLDAALDDRLVYVNTIAERDALTVTVGQQVSVSGIIYENIGVGTWSNLSGFTTPEVYGAAGDGAADDTAALQAVAAIGGVIRGGAGKTYSVAGQVDFAAGTVLELLGATLAVGFTHAADTPVLTFGDDCSVDSLAVNLLTTFDCDVLIDIQGARFQGGCLEVTSDDQQDNRSSASNAGVVVSGDDFYIGRISTSNFDNGIRIVGGNGRLDYASVTSYVRGFWLDPLADNFEFGKISTKTKSPNAAGSPGHNGALFTSASNLRGDSVRVEDSGEHGVRFGGNPGANGVVINSITSVNSGGDGVKFRCSSESLNRNIRILSIECVDCGDASSPITNQEGLHLERVDRVYIGSYIVRKENKTFSCHNGISSFNANNVRIDSVRIEDTNREAFYFESESNDDMSSPEFKTIVNFNVGGGHVVAPGRHAIWLNLDTAGANHIHFDGPINIRQLPSANAALLIGAVNGASMGGESLFNLHWIRITPTSGDPIRGAGLNSNVLLQVIGNGGASSTSAKAGSTWWNTISGVRLIRDSGTGNWVDII